MPQEKMKQTKSGIIHVGYNMAEEMYQPENERFQREIGSQRTFVRIRPHTGTLASLVVRPLQNAFVPLATYDVRRRMNPGGSVKDRAALYLVSDAEKRGDLKPGGTVVEGGLGRIQLQLLSMLTVL